jgi:hypothetical protein
MASKKYTLNYFINFFKEIPDHRWTEGELHREGTVQKCALGWAGTDFRGDVTSDPETVTGRVEALENFLGDTAGINDGDSSEYLALGRTPRGRVLRALRNRKRYGNVIE